MYHHLFEAIGDSIIVSMGVARNNVSNNTRNNTNPQIHVGFLVIHKLLGLIRKNGSVGR